MLDIVGPTCLTCEAMPHITIEYSSNVATPIAMANLVDHVHAAALEHGLPQLAALRTRAVSRDQYRVATGDDEYGFIAILARIGPGRTTKEKQSFVNCLLDAAEESLSERGDSEMQIAYSAEVQEINPAFRVNRNYVRSHLEQQSSTDSTISSKTSNSRSTDEGKS